MSRNAMSTHAKDSTKDVCVHCESLRISLCDVENINSTECISCLNGTHHAMEVVHHVLETVVTASARKRRKENNSDKLFFSSFDWTLPLFPRKRIFSH